MAHKARPATAEKLPCGCGRPWARETPRRRSPYLICICGEMACPKAAIRRGSCWMLPPAKAQGPRAKDCGIYRLLVVNESWPQKIFCGLGCTLQTPIDAKTIRFARLTQEVLDRGGATHTIEQVPPGSRVRACRRLREDNSLPRVPWCR